MIHLYKIQKRKAEPISVPLSAAGFAVFSAKDKDFPHCIFPLPLRCIFPPNKKVFAFGIDKAEKL